MGDPPATKPPTAQFNAYLEQELGIQCKVLDSCYVVYNLYVRKLRLSAAAASSPQPPRRSTDVAPPLSGLLPSADADGPPPRGNAPSLQNTLDSTTSSQGTPAQSVVETLASFAQKLQSADALPLSSPERSSRFRFLSNYFQALPTSAAQLREAVVQFGALALQQFTDATVADVALKSAVSVVEAALDDINTLPTDVHSPANAPHTDALYSACEALFSKCIEPRWKACEAIAAMAGAMHPGAHMTKKVVSHLEAHCRTVEAAEDFAASAGEPLKRLVRAVHVLRRLRMSPNCSLSADDIGAIDDLQLVVGSGGNSLLASVKPAGSPTRSSNGSGPNSPHVAERPPRPSTATSSTSDRSNPKVVASPAKDVQPETGGDEGDRLGDNAVPAMPTPPRERPSRGSGRPSPTPQSTVTPPRSRPDGTEVAPHTPVSSHDMASGRPRVEDVHDVLRRLQRCADGNELSDGIGHINLWLRRRGLAEETRLDQSSGKVVPVASDSSNFLPHGNDAVWTKDDSADYEQLCLKHELLTQTTHVCAQISDLLDASEEEFIRECHEELLSTLLSEADDCCVATKERQQLEKRLDAVMRVRVKVFHHSGEVRIATIPQRSTLAHLQNQLGGHFPDMGTCRLSYLDDGDKITVNTDGELSDFFRSRRGAMIDGMGMNTIRSITSDLNVEIFVDETESYSQTLLRKSSAPQGSLRRSSAESLRRSHAPSHGGSAYHGTAPRMDPAPSAREAPAMDDDFLDALPVELRMRLNNGQRKARSQPQPQPQPAPALVVPVPAPAPAPARASAPAPAQQLGAYYNPEMHFPVRREVEQKQIEHPQPVGTRRPSGDPQQSLTAVVQRGAPPHTAQPDGRALRRAQEQSQARGRAHWDVPGSLKFASHRSLDSSDGGAESPPLPPGDEDERPSPRPTWNRGSEDHVMEIMRSNRVGQAVQNMRTKGQYRRAGRK